MLQLKKHYDVAFFGSSRTEKHIDCELITELTGKSCINFGISGGSPGDMLILMKLAKNRKLTFNQVFMQVDYNYNSYGITEAFKANLVPFIGNPAVKEQLQKYNGGYIYGRIPFYGYMEYEKVVGLRQLTTTFLKRKTNIDLEIVFTPLQGIGTDVPESFSFPKTINDLSPELIQMQELYNNTNTKFEFFTAPYCSKVENRKFIEKVQLKIPGLHNYIDLFDGENKYFFNCGHLNEEGAEVFTKTFVEDLL